MVKIFVISMDDVIGYKRRLRLTYEYEWFKGNTKHLSFIDDKMIHMHSSKEKCRKGKTGCFDSYYRLFKKIYDEKISNVIIAEDDCLLKELPDGSIYWKTLPDKPCYLNGKFINAKDWKTTNEFEKKEGLNEIDYDNYRIIGTWGMYFPKYTDVKPIIDFIENSKRLRAIDIMLAKHKLIKHYLYPSVLINDSKGISQIQLKGDGLFDNYVKR